MTKYKHIFFDIDNTLWDFKANSDLTQHEMYKQFGLDEFFSGAEEFISIYHEYNDELWEDYRKGRIEKSKLKWYRFYLSLKEKFVENERLARELDDFYLTESPKKTGLIPGAIDLLEELKKRYSLHVITNGFNEVQYTKLDNSNLRVYFKTVVTSEDAGIMKPDPAIFEFALEKAGAKKEESIMVGDVLGVDILGARNAGIDQIYLAPNGHRHNEEISFQVSRLEEILEIL